MTGGPSAWRTTATIRDAELRQRRGCSWPRARRSCGDCSLPRAFRTRSVLLTAPALEAPRALEAADSSVPVLPDEPRDGPRRLASTFTAAAVSRWRARGVNRAGGANTGCRWSRVHPRARGRLESRQRGRCLQEREGLRLGRDPPLPGCADPCTGSRSRLHGRSLVVPFAHVPDWTDGLAPAAGVRFCPRGAFPPTDRASTSPPRHRSAPSSPRRPPARRRGPGLRAETRANADLR